MSDSTNSRFLTTEESSLTANVSTETILKYKELGLLRAFRVNGQEQFREDEIKLVFNSRRKTEVKENVQENFSPAEQPMQTSRSSEEPPTLKEILSETEPSSQSANHVEHPHERLNSSIQIEHLPLHDRANNPDFRGSFDIPSIELLELTRTLKDQLETVKEERNWLRRRVEKLESSLEREQMILISKTETLRNIVDQSVRPKNSWSFLLPWNK